MALVTPTSTPSRENSASRSNPVIGVLCGEEDRERVTEFFELLKTPWSFFDEDAEYGAVVTTSSAHTHDLSAPAVLVFSKPQGDDPARGPRKALVHDDVRIPIFGPARALEDDGSVRARFDDGSAAIVEHRDGDTAWIRFGYDLFDEVERLLGSGQPAGDAMTPTLDAHVDLLRRTLVSAIGLLVEVPPVRAGSPYTVCLTHDIDFLELRRHGFGRTLFGFVHRAVFGSLRDLVSGRGDARRLVRNWSAVALLPLVYARVIRDPWQPFRSYLAADGSARSTFFVIPFRDRGGEGVTGRVRRRRAVSYEANEIRDTLRDVVAHGHEVALHGIDSWHSSAAAAIESARVTDAAGAAPRGVRMHWLYRSAETPFVLDDAGLDYDASLGYNDAVGFRAGTTQIFRPLGCRHLLELPLHLQDTALFYPRRMHLAPAEAWRAVERLRAAARRHGGALTVSWHDRSLAPERLWGRFYARLLHGLRADGARFDTAAGVVDWFRLRRSLSFGEVTWSDSEVTVALESDFARAAAADFVLRVHVAGDGRARSLDVPWHGEPELTVAFTPNGRALQLR